MTLLTSVPRASYTKKGRERWRERDKTAPYNRKDIFRRIKRPKRPALDTATPPM